MPKPHRKGPSAKSRAKQAPEEPKTTSWGGVADWYDSYLETTPDSYQEAVIAPNLLRILEPKRGMNILDLACGQGFFSRKFLAAGATAVGADISKELIEQAKKRAPKITFYATPAHKLSFAQGQTFDAVTIVLAIQNIQNIGDVFTEVFRVLKPGGRLVLVLNHPAFRVPKRSGWGYDPRSGTQYRRIDGYLSASTETIDMHPGQKGGAATVSYHRSLQDFFKILGKSGFAVTKLEEWISHKKSQAGPKQKAEDAARKEIPLFMLLEATKNR